MNKSDTFNNDTARVDEAADGAGVDCADKGAAVRSVAWPTGLPGPRRCRVHQEVALSLKQRDH